VVKPEIRLPLTAIFFLGIGIPFLYVGNLGIFTAILFALASLILFVVFFIMPRQLMGKVNDLQNHYQPIYRSIFLKKKANLEAEYQSVVNSWIGVAVFLLVLGIIVYAMTHWSL
jgi:hypothetical protein